MWLGHSAVKIIAPNDKVLLIDPFLTHNPKTPENEKIQPKVDYIFLTHGHEDHVGDTLEIAKATGAKVVAMVELSGLLKSDGLPEDQAVEMNKGGSIEFDGFTVTMTHANHSTSFGGRYAGEPAGFVIGFKKDITVYHAGDTCIMPDFKLIRKLYKPDLAFLPIGGHYTMGVKEAVLASGMLKAKKTVPIHYGTWPILSGSPEEFADKATDKHTEVVVATPGEWMF